MSKGRPVNGHAKRPRLQIPLSNAQRKIVFHAAELAGADHNTWALAQVMCAADPGGEAADAPLVLSGKLSARVRARARAQQITPSQLIEQLMLGRGAS